jgi:DNA (cytosine-5)-methyltransferase 1
MRYLSTFSGIGGLDLGFDRAGMTCVGQVEIDKHARAILDRHWPDVPKHDDITTAKEWASDAGLVGAVDLVCGGAPCQDLSVAGKREGLAGSRSRLVLDMVALAAHVQAHTIVYENVPGLLSSNQGRDFGVLQLALADAGFPVIEWRVLDSRYWGVPQRRRRVFVVASTAERGRRAVLLEPEGSAGDSHQVNAARSQPPADLGPGAALGGWSAGGVTTAIASKWAKGSSGPAGDEHHNLVVTREL